MAFDSLVVLTKIKFPGAHSALSTSGHFLILQYCLSGWIKNEISGGIRQGPATICIIFMIISPFICITLPLSLYTALTKNVVNQVSVSNDKMWDAWGGGGFFSWYGNLKQIYNFVNKMLRPVINWRSLEIARWLISPSSANAKVLTLSLVVLRVKIKSVPLLNFSVTLCHFFPCDVFPKRQKPS